MVMNTDSTVTAKGRRRRQWRRTATRERILRAAVDLFSKRGYVAATVEEIAETADVAKGTFFNYFRTKDDLLIAMFQGLADVFEVYTRGIAGTQDVRGYLRDFAHRFVEHPVRYPMLLRSILAVALADPEMGRAFNEALLDRGLKAHSALLRRGQRLGQVRKDIPARFLARMFQQMMLGTEAIWALTSPRAGFSTRQSKRSITFADRAPTTGTDGNLHNWLDRALDVYWAGIEGPSPKAKGVPAKAPRRASTRAPK